MRSDSLSEGNWYPTALWVTKSYLCKSTHTICLWPASVFIVLTPCKQVRTDMKLFTGSAINTCRVAVQSSANPSSICSWSCCIVLWMAVDMRAKYDTKGDNTFHKRNKVQNSVTVVPFISHRRSSVSVKTFMRRLGQMSSPKYLM